MRIIDRSVYVGPSLYARFPVIRLELDLGALEQWPTGRLGGSFVDALAAALPGLVEHGCSTSPGSAAAKASTKLPPKRPVGHCSSAPKSNSRRMTGKRAYSEGPT